MHKTRQVIPGFNVKNTLDKRDCKTTVWREGREHQEETKENRDIRETRERDKKGISRTPIKKLHLAKYYKIQPTLHKAS